MVGILIIVIIIGIVLFLSGRKPTPIPDPPVPPVPPEPPAPPPIPDPTGHRWQLVDKTTERWKRYEEGMEYVKSDTLMALEMVKTVDGKKFYIWTAEAGDYWETPDEVYEKGKVDCDGFARLTSDGLARFAKYPDVWWLEYYGYYRYYYFDRLNDKWTYDIRLGGHAITVYKKNNELLAFSNTQWWHDKNFQDYVAVGEMTFPEGTILIRCRHWDTGILQWIQEADEGEILEGSNIFDRESKVVIGWQNQTKYLKR